MAEPRRAITRPTPEDDPFALSLTLVTSREVADLIDTPAAIRHWARERGIGVAERGRIPDTVRELYRASPSVVRAWARRNGVATGERGPLSNEVLESYLARPSAVREWAQRKGIPIAGRGRIASEVLETYLEPYRALTRQAG